MSAAAPAPAARRRARHLAPFEAMVLDGVPPPPSWHVPALLGLIVLAVAAGLAWAHLTTLDQVRRATARVVPSRAVQVVQHLEGGIVRDLQVREGDIVDQGQIVAEIANPSLSADLRDRTGRLLAEQAKAARLRAEADGRPGIVFPDRIRALRQLVQTETQLFEARREQREQQRVALEQDVARRQGELREANARLGGLRRTLDIAQRELEQKRVAAERQVIGQADYLAAQRQVEASRTEVATASETVPKLRNQILESQARLAALAEQFRTESLTELAKSEAEIASLTQTEAAAEDRVGRTAVRSPVRGVVKTLAVRTAGGVIKPGDTLMEIVPLDDQLLVEARFATQDVGGLHAGLPAAVRVTAYDYNRFGTLHGAVVDVSPDALQGDRPGELYYRVRIRTEQATVVGDGKTMPVLPGMVCDVDVITGRRSVLATLVAPIARVADRALRETGRSGI